ncbi:hypothetical protein [Peribacillus sp. NPDC058002]|uniref:hypothetical protein n=1 Tax=Peribacillus sp. NPDC058002 TaxID=3346301 RepID=UPI0036DF4C82
MGVENMYPLGEYSRVVNNIKRKENRENPDLPITFGKNGPGTIPGPFISRLGTFLYCP